MKLSRTRSSAALLSLAVRSTPGTALRSVHGWTTSMQYGPGPHVHVGARLHRSTPSSPMPVAIAIYTQKRPTCTSHQLNLYLSVVLLCKYAPPDIHHQPSAQSPPLFLHLPIVTGYAALCCFALYNTYFCDSMVLRPRHCPAQARIRIAQARASYTLRVSSISSSSGASVDLAHNTKYRHRRLVKTKQLSNMTAWYFF